MTDEKHFSPERFRNPGKDYAPIYSWVWNGPLTEEEIDGQIAEMHRLGIRAFYIIPEPQNFRPASMPTRMDPNYLTSAYFRFYRYAMDKAREYGMECWLYDEGGWPSGGACGQVLYAHPEFARRILRHSRRMVKAGEIYRPDENVSAAFIGDDCMIEEGYCFPQDTEVNLYESYASAWEAPGIPDYPDLTVKEAAQAFIRITHERYAAHLGGHFGNTLTAVFTDEPKAPHLPFREELCRIYAEEYGESILPHLPVLAGRLPLNEERAEIRRRWYDLCSRMFCENFLLECKKWANAHQMHFCGHMDKDDDPMGCMSGCSFHILRSLRCLDLPGVDAIWRQIFPGEQQEIRMNGTFVGIQAENRFFPRYASSAAAQTGNSFALTESFAVYGNGLTFEQMRFVLGFQTIRGVTVINPMLIAYARDGFTIAGEAPAFAEKHACHRDLPWFNRYAERLSYICSLGDRVCDTALYYPVNDYWGGLNDRAMANAFESLGQALEAKGIDFDILDDDIILQGEGLQKGVIRLGHAQYRKIVLPEGAYLPTAVRERLDLFRQGGGLVTTDAGRIQPEICLCGGSGKIRTMKRHTDRGDLLCLYNESTEPQTLSVSLDWTSGYYADITLGELYPLNAMNGTVALTLESGETCALYLTDEALPCTDRFIAGTEHPLDGPYTFRITERYVIGESSAPQQDEAELPAVPGEWSALTGRDFSGSGIYTTTFADPGKDALLDLGDVRHTGEVFLNGHSLGVRIMKPYRYLLPHSLMLPENRLEIRVSNTPGNQHHYTKYFDRYKGWQMSSYKNVQDQFDCSTLDSGLFGPIKLWVSDN